MLVDLLDGGHHSTYLTLFAQALLRLGYRVLVASPRPQLVLGAVSSGKKNDEFIDRTEGMTGRLQGLTVVPPVPSKCRVGRLQPYLDAITRWQVTHRLLQQWIETTGIWPELVIFPYLDAYLSPYLLAPQVDRYFTLPWAGLYMKPKHLRLQPWRSRLYRLLLGNAQLLRSRHCKAIATLDRGVLHDLQVEAGGTPVTLFPDIADDSAPQMNYGPARAIAEQAQGRTVVGLIGSLDRRKGIGTLLEVVRQAQSQPYLFAMAGRFSQADFRPGELRTVLSILESQPANCFFSLTPMPGEAEFNAVLASFDIVFAAYLKFPCSSNMLAKAALFGKPIIVSDGFYMAEQVRRYGLGVVVPENDPAACLVAIATLAQRSPATIVAMEQGMAQYLKDNSFDQLVVCLDRLVRRES